MKFVDSVMSPSVTPSWEARRRIAELKGWCVKREFSQCDCTLCKGGNDHVREEEEK